MKKNSWTILLLLVACMLTFTQCSNDDEKEVMCTAVFESISLKLTYPNGEPVLLDSYTVFWESEDRFLEKDETAWREARPYGSYLIVNDFMQEELEGKEEVMFFKGYLNNELVYERELFVGANRCHVYYCGTEPLVQIIE